MDEKVKEALSKLEKRLERLENMVQSNKEDNIVQNQFMKQMSDYIKKQDRRYEKQEERAEKQTQSLIILTHEVTDIRNDVSTLKVKVDENEKQSNISIPSMLKSAITYLIIGGLTSSFGIGILFYLLSKR